MSHQIVQMGGAAPGLSGDRVTMYVQNPQSLALPRGTVVRITRSSTSGVEEANAMLAATTGSGSILAACGIHAVLLEDSTADSSALVHVCLRGRVDTLLSRVAGGAAVNGDTLLILATGGNAGGSQEYQGHLCGASGAPASGDALGGETVSPNPHKVMGYYVDSLANALDIAGEAGLRTIDFDGIAGYGMALGPIDVVPDGA